MFYSIQILSRKGALGTIWIASHLEKRLKRNQIFETNIPASVDSVLNSEAPLALRLSGQLLLGIVRVYLRKLQYLQADAEHAVDGLSKGTGQGGAGVDLPDGGTAPEMAITLPDSDPMALFASGAAADLFPTFEADLLSLGGLPAAGRGVFGGGSDSLTVAEDISELFGSKWSGPADDERFDVPEQIDRRFSIELERLRSAAAAEAAKPGEGLFFEPPPEDVYELAAVPEDEFMAPPPDELFAVQPTAEDGGRTPASERRGPSLSAGAPLPGLSDMRITPGSLAGPDLLLPDLGYGPATVSSPGGSVRSVGQQQQQQPGGEDEAAAGDAQQEAPPSTGRRQRHAAARARQPRRRMPALDVDAHGNPATELKAAAIRSLLQDRKPLLVQRGLRAHREPQPLPPQRYDVAAQLDPREHMLLVPNAFTVLAPELLALFEQAGPAGRAGAEAPTPGSARRRRSAAAAAAAEQAEVAAAAAADAPQSAEPAPEWEGPGSGLTSQAALSDLPQADWIEDSQQQQPDLPLPEAAEESRWAAEAAEGLAAPSPFSARRASLSLAPSTVGGELGSVDAEGSDGSGLPAYAHDAFTRRTRLALAHLQAQFQPVPGSKRRHPSQGGLAATEIRLDDVVAGKTRLDAARWFFETLVLTNRGYLDLRQEEPYGPIAILPRQKLLEPAVPQ